MNTPIEKAEITLTQWATSKWSLIAQRIMVTVCTLLLTLGGAFITWAVLSTKGDIGTVATIQNDRAVDGENFQTEIRGTVTLLRTDLTDLRGDLQDVAVDVGVIKRLLADIRRDVAAADPLARPRVLEPLAASLVPLTAIP